MMIQIKILILIDCLLLFIYLIYLYVKACMLKTPGAVCYYVN